MLGLEVIKKVADGSAVEAFLARSLSGQVLVQVSRPEVSSDPQIYGEFLDWTRVASQLRHPALLTVEHTHAGSDGRFLVMTGPVSGLTAQEYLAKQGPLTPAEALRWARRLCEGLAYLHAHQLVHGFLAPSNLYLDGNWEHPTVRLLDTGFLLFRATRSLTSSQVLVPAEYLSPARAAGQRATVRDDVYGFGVLFYELLTGAAPFRGATPDETRELHARASLPPLPESLVGWRPFFEGCLAKRDVDRFSSMEAVHAALAAIGADATHTPVIEANDLVDASLVSEPRLTLAQGLAPGTALGAYEVLDTLGEGGMGRVYLAEHRTLGRRVAIKVLRDELGGAGAARFVQEAQAVNRVHHPNIVQVFDLVQETAQEGGRTWFVMELLEGQSLKALGRDAPIELPRVVHFMRQAAEALAAAHSVGVVHRDIKPDNLHVTFPPGEPTNRGLLKVLDFGVARVRSANAGIPRTTQVGQVVGTPLWMAPEQILGKDVDAKADVYGLATVMYVMLLRRFPFDGVAMADVVMQRLQKDARPTGSYSFLGEPISRELGSLLDDCLARDIARRPTMADVATRLAALEQSLSSSEAEISDDRPMRLWPFMLGGVVIATAVAAWLRLHH